MNRISIYLFVVFLHSCQKGKAPLDTVKVVNATLETVSCVAVNDDDAADDPAFWLNKNDPNMSYIFGTNKTRGLEVYSLLGERLAEYPIGRINNVDVSLGMQFGSETIDIVAASNRDFDRIDIWRIRDDPTQFELVSDTNFRTTIKGVYGFCLWKGEHHTFAFVNNKKGEIEQWKLKNDTSFLGFQFVRKYLASGQVEGMVVDAKTKKLYVGEEDGGIYAYDLTDTASEREKIPLSGEENSDIKYDIEGLTIYDNGNQHLLLGSSQGNNRFVVYDLADDHKYLGAFQVVYGDNDRVEETDGIDVFPMQITDDYPNGIFICQDGFNKNEKGKLVPQNFKIVNWNLIAEVLGIN